MASILLMGWQAGAVNPEPKSFLSGLSQQAVEHCISAIAGPYALVDAELTAKLANLASFDQASENLRLRSSKLKLSTLSLDSTPLLFDSKSNVTFHVERWPKLQVVATLRNGYLGRGKNTRFSLAIAGVRELSFLSANEDLTFEDRKLFESYALDALRRFSALRARAVAKYLKKFERPNRMTVSEVYFRSLSKGRVLAYFNLVYANSNSIYDRSVTVIFEADKIEFLVSRKTNQLSEMVGLFYDYSSFENRVYSQVSLEPLMPSNFEDVRFTADSFLFETLWTHGQRNRDDISQGQL